MSLQILGDWANSDGFIAGVAQTRTTLTTVCSVANYKDRQNEPDARLFFSAAAASLNMLNFRRFENAQSCLRLPCL